DGLAIRFDDLRFDHRAAPDLLLAEHLEAFPGIAVEPGGVDCGDVAAIGARRPLFLIRRQPGPGRPDRQPRHIGYVEGGKDDRFELLVAAFDAELCGALHRVEQLTVELPDDVRRACGSRWGRRYE